MLNVQSSADIFLSFQVLYFFIFFFCFLFYSTYGFANGIPVIMEGQYKSIGEKLILVFDLLTLNT